MRVFFYITILLIISLLHDNNRVIKLGIVPELFTVDKLGNCYVYHKSQLKKYSSEGKLISQYSRLESGKLYSIDASDPMILLLFYKDFNQVVFLDNKLNPIGSPVFLDQLNFLNVTAVSKSKQLAMWLYDEYENKLIQYGFNPKGVRQTINLKNNGKDELQINFILENGNEIFLNQPGSAIWVFDVFGSLLKKIDIKIDKDFQLVGGNLFYNNGYSIINFNLTTSEKDTVLLQEFKKFDNIKYLSDNLYILNGDSISIIKSEIKLTD